MDTLIGTLDQGLWTFFLNTNLNISDFYNCCMQASDTVASKEDPQLDGTRMADLNKKLGEKAERRNCKSGQTWNSRHPS